MQGYGGNLSKSYLKANKLAGEAVSNIRTVAAFCSEEKLMDLYARELEAPSKRSFQRGQIAGIFYGVSQCCLFSSYGLALWYMLPLLTLIIPSPSGIISNKATPIIRMRSTNKAYRCFFFFFNLVNLGIFSGMDLC